MRGRAVLEEICALRNAQDEADYRLGQLLPRLTGLVLIVEVGEVRPRRLSGRVFSVDKRNLCFKMRSVTNEAVVYNLYLKRIKILAVSS